MRLNLVTTPNRSPVPFEYLQLISGVLHKWLGDNVIHGSISLYSYSFLHRGEKNGEMLGFPNGSNWFISSYENKLLQKITHSIQNDPEFICGMRITNIIIQKDPDFSGQELFFPASPVLIKRYNEGKQKNYLMDDPESGNLLKETLLHKMQIAGLSDNDLHIEFDTSYPRKKTKLISYKGIKNKCSVCPLIIRGKPETKAFAWNVGIGNSTGIGFGALK